MAPSGFLLQPWLWQSQALLSSNLLFLSLSSHLFISPFDFLSLSSFLSLVSLSKATHDQNQTTATTASMAAHAGGGEPEDARMVATNPFRRETASLEVVEVHEGHDGNGVQTLVNGHP